MFNINFFTRREWGLILLVGFGYFLNLFILRGQILLKETLKVMSSIFKEDAAANASFDAKYMLFMSAGLLIGAVLWGWLADNFSRKKSLQWSAFLHCIACAVLPLFYFFNQKNVGAGDVYSWRFITALLIAGEFGIGLTLIIEEMPRSKRLWGVAWTTAIGMLGICTFAVIAIGNTDAPGSKDFFEKNLPILWFGTALSLFLFFIRWKYLSAKEEKKILPKAGILESWHRLFSDKNQFARLVFLGLVGLPIQFMINFLIQKVVGICGEGSETNKAYLFYYLSFFCSVFIFFYFYNRLQRSVAIIRYGLWVQAAAIAQFIYFPIGFPYQLKCVLLGLGGGIWGILALMAIESSHERFRASSAIFVSNFPRIALVFLTFSWSLDAKNPGTVFLFGLSLLGIAGLATFGLQEAFSPKLKNSEASLSPRLLHEDALGAIRKAQTHFFKSKNVRQYFNDSAEGLRETIFCHFNTMLFAFYGVGAKSSERGIEIVRSDFQKDTELFEQNEGPAADTVEMLRNLNRQLIGNGQCFSFTDEVLRRNLPVVLVYQSPKPFRFLVPLFSMKKEPLPQGGWGFDLSEIQFTNEDVKMFWSSNFVDLEDVANSLDRLASNAFGSLLLKKVSDFSKDEREQTLLKRSLVLHKLDAARYRRGYFSYYVSPNYEDQNGVLFLCTRFPASPEQLFELRNLATIVMNAVFVVEAKDTSYKDILNQSLHTQNTMFAAIDQNLNGMQSAFKKGNEQDFDENMNAVRLHFDSISNVNNLLYALKRVGYRCDNLDKRLPTNVRNFLETEKIELAKAITERLKTIWDARKNLVFEEEEMEPRREMIENAIQQVQKDFTRKSIVANKTALLILLHDTLTNAFRYNDPTNPELHISLHETSIEELPEEKTATIVVENYMTLAISNRFKLSHDGYRTMLGEEVENNRWATSRRFGLNSIRRILKYDGLGKPAGEWFYLPKHNCFETDMTTILILLPKNIFEQ